MSDNPFAGPGDNERTVFLRPTPGGRSGSVPPPAAAGAAAPASAPPFAPQAFAPQPFAPPPYPPSPYPPQPAPAQSAAPPGAAVPGGAAPGGEPIGRLATGQSPLLTAAAPLLQLLGRLNNTFNPPDPGNLRERMVQAVREFETAARGMGIPHEVVHPARYALCASIDDVVMHTPWGGASTYVQASLVSIFHQDVVGGEAFFHQLAALKREPARNLALLELMYLCLSLGFQGQYRLSQRGPAQLERVREDLYQTIVQLRQPYEQGLSPRWKGETAPYRPARGVVPVWVMAVVAITVVGLTWGVFSLRLNAASDEAFAAAIAVPPARMPGLARVALAPLAVAAAPQPRPAPQPAPPPSDVVVSLHRFLQPEIDAKLVIVTQTQQAVGVRIFNRGMFALGSATVRADFVPLLERIGEALNEEPGRVLVTGHTDNLPIHTVQFPSNFQLSLARAQAASAIMLHRLRDPTRLVIEGRADSQPVAPNDTEDDRAQNRRIDVILQRRS